MILTNYHGLESGFILTEYEAPPIGSFKEEVENVKICGKLMWEAPSISRRQNPGI